MQWIRIYSKNIKTRLSSPRMLKIKFVWNYLVKNSRKLSIGCMKKEIKMLRINFLINCLRELGKLHVPPIEKAMQVILMNQNPQNRLRHQLLNKLKAAQQLD